MSLRYHYRIGILSRATCFSAEDVKGFDLKAHRFIVAQNLKLVKPEVHVNYKNFTAKLIVL